MLFKQWSMQGKKQKLRKLFMQLVLIAMFQAAWFFCKTPSEYRRRRQASQRKLPITP